MCLPESQIPRRSSFFSPRASSHQNIKTSLHSTPCKRSGILRLIRLRKNFTTHSGRTFSHKFSFSSLFNEIVRESLRSTPLWVLKKYGRLKCWVFLSNEHKFKINRTMSKSMENFARNHFGNFGNAI